MFVIIQLRMNSLCIQHGDTPVVILQQTVAVTHVCFVSENIIGYYHVVQDYQLFF